MYRINKLFIINKEKRKSNDLEVKSCFLLCIYNVIY